MAFYPESTAQDSGSCASQHFGIAVVGSAALQAFLQITASTAYVWVIQ